MIPTAQFVDGDGFQSQSDAFVQWLVQRPGVRLNPKIRVVDLRFRDAGRGVVAQTDILEGEELFSIPRDLILTMQNSNLRNLIGQDLDQLGPWFSLIVVMIYEYLLGEKSAWAPYFQVLPTTFDTPMFWSDSELIELQGSAVVGKIGKQGAEESILEMVAPVVRGNPTLFPPPASLGSFDGPAGTAALLHIAHVMGSLIMAYAFDIEKPEDEEGDEGDGEDGYMTDEEEEQLPKGMVPLADLLNANADQNNARLFQEDDFLVMKAIKLIRAGDEIFNDYGEIPRSDLLRRYGYVTDNYSPFDVVEISLDAICEAAGLQNADTVSQSALQFLEDLELLDDGYAIARPSSGDSLEDIIPAELVILLKTLSLSPEQLQQQRSKNKPPKPSFGPQEVAILQKAILIQQTKYSTSLFQDQELLAQLNQLSASAPLDIPTRRRRMAIQVRIGEKEILQELSARLHLTNRDSSLKRSADGDHHDSRHTKTQRT